MLQSSPRPGADWLRCRSLWDRGLSCQAHGGHGSIIMGILNRPGTYRSLLSLVSPDVAIYAFVEWPRLESVSSALKEGTTVASGGVNPLSDCDQPGEGADAPLASSFRNRR